MIGIIDYGMGNIGSILNMLKKIGAPAFKVTRADDIKRATKIILPGVGAFDHAMQRLNDQGFSNSIKEQANLGIPILGICLGMQLLGSSSEEGVLEGLGLIPGKIKRFPHSEGMRIPHMGWNAVNEKDPQLFRNLNENKFYFVHSYYYDPEDKTHSAGTTDYGIAFTACVRRDNICGSQFHPEKSHKYGMQFLRNFKGIEI